MTQDLVDAANTLAEVLEHENAALKRLDFNAAAALVQAKEAALSGVTRGCAAVPGVDRNPALVGLGRRMSSLAAENRSLLEHAIAVQTRIVGIVIRAAASPPVVGQYAANGLKSQPRRAAAMALSARA